MILGEGGEEGGGCCNLLIVEAWSTLTTNITIK